MSKSLTSKSTIKNDPFRTLIPIAIESNATADQGVEVVSAEVNAELVEKPRPANSDRKRRTVAMVEMQPEKLGKQKLTVHLESSLAERVKNAAYWNPRLTIAGIAEQGIRLAIERFEREHGGKYPPARRGTHRRTADQMKPPIAITRRENQMGDVTTAR